jgi:hypothetical protein
MKKLAFGTQAVVRAWLLALGCGAIIAACSSSEDSPGTNTAGSGGMAGESEAGKNSGGTQAGNTQAGKAGMSQGGTGGKGGSAGSSSTQAGEAGASVGEAGAAMGGTGAGGEETGGSPAEAGAGGAAGGGGTLACEEGAFCKLGDGCALSGKCKSNVCVPVDPKLATLDQSQLGGMIPDSWNVSDASRMGQLLTVGKNGLLTGVELSLQVDCKATIGNLNLYVYDVTSKALLGKAFESIMYLACDKGGNLVADKIGKAFWDLSSQCIGVESGQKLRVELRSPTMGTCVADHCVGGPYPGAGCNTDLLCTGIIISAAEPDNYDGGWLTSGETAATAEDDSAYFKTFVLE